jgi:hypothetical protein
MTADTFQYNPSSNPISLLIPPITIIPDEFCSKQDPIDDDVGSTKQLSNTLHSFEIL